MSIFAFKMLSKARKKELISLKLKKYRQRYGQFLVEGEKSVLELCQSNYKVSEILISQFLFNKIGNRLPQSNILIISEKELEQLSTFETSAGIIAVSNFREISFDSIMLKTKFTLMLDAISDPGNLGTIIRTADWYGIETIICSPNCVDLYNPKTIASSMGSFTRVTVIYHDLQTIIKNNNVNSFACAMNGISIKDIPIPLEGIIIIGNEAKGINPELLKLASQKITIPRIGHAESLNAAIAAAIVCHTFIVR